MRKIIIIGGTSGIGEAILKRLKNDMIFVISRNHSKFIVNKNIHYFNFDINNENEIKNFFKNNNFQFDVIIHSAGTTDIKSFEDTEIEILQKVMNTNLISVMKFNKIAIPFLKKYDNSSIIHISSVCGFKPCESISYSVSKAGLDMFTKTLAIELAKYNIRVNSVNPGITRTNFHTENKVTEHYDDWLETMKKNNINNEVLDPDEIAKAVEFLISENSKSITGTIIPIGVV
jgi:NAD(P)-dependent dehydrogenase (short-subunit alcohol dehydrogenase family)